MFVPNSLVTSLTLAQADPEIGAAGGILGGLFGLIWLALIIASIAGLWMTFVKAGKPGWGAIIPIYNMVLLVQVAKRPIWWVLLLFIPLVNIIIVILISLDVAKNFGKGPGFGLGLGLLGFIFYPILGFGPAKYLGGTT